MLSNALDPRSYSQWSKITKIYQDTALVWFLSHAITSLSSIHSTKRVKCMSQAWRPRNATCVVWSKRQHTTHSHQSLAPQAVLISPLGSSLNLQGFTSTWKMMACSIIFLFFMWWMSPKNAKNTMEAWWSPFWSIASYVYHALTWVCLHSFWQGAPSVRAVARNVSSKKSGLSSWVGNMCMMQIIFADINRYQWYK